MKAAYYTTAALHMKNFSHRGSQSNRGTATDADQQPGASSLRMAAYEQCHLWLLSELCPS